MIPFKTFNGYLKRIDIKRFSGEYRSIFEFVFPDFFVKAKYNRPAINQTKYKETVRKLESIDNLKHCGNEVPFNYRRFSGGSYLDRGNYYSVCMNSSGDDSQTLVCELLAYHRPEKSGEIALLDLDGSDETSMQGRLFFSEKCGLSHVENTIVLQCSSRCGVLSPVIDRIKTPLFIPGTKNLPFFLTTEVIKSEIPNVIDLRYPEVQKWMYESLLNGIEKVIYLYSDQLSFSAYYPKVISDELMNASRDKYGAYINPPNTNWNGKNTFYSNQLLDLFSVLMFSPSLGGSPITNEIGRWLQSIGAQALIYPSARSNVMCKVQNNSLSDFAGFALVDYRDIDEIPSYVRVISEPYSWRENWAPWQIGQCLSGSDSWRFSGITEMLIELKWQETKKFYKSRGASFN